MELIQLTPHSEVDPSQPLRAPGDILLHAYLIPNALNPAQLARRTGIPSNHIKAFIADTQPITPKIALRLSLSEPEILHMHAIRCVLLDTPPRETMEHLKPALRGIYKRVQRDVERASNELERLRRETARAGHAPMHAS